MNILLVSGIFAKSKRDILGGMAKAVYMTAKGLRERGNEVKILTAGRKKRRWDYNNIDVFTIKADNSLNHKNALKDFYGICCREIGIQREIIRINKEWKIDIIQYTGWFGVGLFHFTKIPAIMRISSYTKFQLYTNFYKYNLLVLNKLERMAAKRMNAVFAPSNVMAEAVSNDIKRKVLVIETPFIPEFIEENNKIADSKLRGKRYILFFGRLSVDKGIMVIKKVMNKILEKYGDIYFVFAGSNNVNIETGKMITEELTEASPTYRDRIIFLGYLQHQVLFPVIRKAELILMPSLMDNLPNACAEAMALGSIVIGTDGSSLEQFITDGYNGFLAKINSSDSLEKKIIECLELGAVEKDMIRHRAVERMNRLSENTYFDKLDKLL